MEGVSKGEWRYGWGRRSGREEEMEEEWIREM